MSDDRQKLMQAVADIATSMFTEEQRRQAHWDLVHMGASVVRVTEEGVTVLNPLEVVYGADPPTP